MMKAVRFVVAGTVVLAAVVLGGNAVLSDSGDVAGIAQPLTGDDLKRAVLGRCTWDGVDTDSLRLGPMLRTESGIYWVVATAEDGMLVDCTLDGGGGSAGPYERPDGVKAMLAADLHVEGATTFRGYGWVAPDVARLELVLPDNRVIEAEVARGAFAYTAQGASPGLNVTLRAYDDAGTVIYQSGPAS